ncbi:MAG: ketopantoate reductase family protein [Candidatus Heimdallarchaeota archaeon]
MKAVIYGAGAVGSVLGARLFKAGQHVILVARPDHVAAINEAGLRIRGIEKLTVHVPAFTDPSVVNGTDLVFLTVKSPDTKNAVKEFAPFLSDSAVVVSLQNGVRNPDVIAHIIGEGKIIPGIVRFSATYLKPGEIIHTHEGICIIGERTGEITKRIKQIYSFMVSGIPTRISTNIRAELWGKLILNLLNLPFAICGLPFPKGFENKYLRLITVEAIKEGMVVVKAAGIKAEYHNLESFLELLSDEQKIMDWLAHEPSTRLLRFVSTHQSLIRKTADESDFLTGEIVHLGKKINIKSPINSYLLYKIKEIKEKAQIEYITPKALWQALNSL